MRPSHDQEPRGRRRRRGRVRLPHRIALQFFAVAATTAVIGVAAATWATVETTSAAVRQVQQDTLHDDAGIYSALVDWAARNRDWRDAATLVADLSMRTGQTVVVTDARGVVLAGADRQRLDPREAEARVDALAVDPAIVGTASGSGATSGRAQPVPCTERGHCALYSVLPTARLAAGIPALADPARATVLTARVRMATDDCLRREALPRLTALTGGLIAVVQTPDHRAATAACLDRGLRQVLEPLVAPPALLYIATPAAADVFWDLSSAGRLRIVLLATGVLAATLVLAGLFAARLARPLRIMADVADRAGAGDLAARMPAARPDEIGAVARAFNGMAERREADEQLRARLISDVSHELRTPLANIRGWLEALRDGVADPDPALLATVHGEALHLQRLLDDLDDLELGDTGRRGLEPVPVPLGPFLAERADAFRAAATAVGVVLSVDADHSGVIAADPTRLRQAVSNLVANALRHTPSGGEIVLRAGAHSIEVEDSGEGIPPDAVEGVFDRFRRVDPSRSRATGGHGLGLAIVRQIMTEHGGRASLDSRLGEGTRVTLVFPVVSRPGRRGGTRRRRP